MVNQDDTRMSHELNYHHRSESSSEDEQHGVGQHG
jgi:hypothetical protein